MELKKWMQVAGAGVLAIGVLAGCGGDENDDMDDNDTEMNEEMEDSNDEMDDEMEDEEE